MNELMNGSAMSKARQAFVELREQILDGRLPPGSRLTLRPIAKSLGVNVGAVSEAVRKLVHEQLVDFEPNYGRGSKSSTWKRCRASTFCESPSNARRSGAAPIVSTPAASKR